MEVINSGQEDRQLLSSQNAADTQIHLSIEECRSAVKSVFASTSCYDLISSSSKTIVFETTIPFQLAFYALTEHDTSVAPLWDPAQHAFTGLMTIADYLQALKLCRKENVTMMELSTRSIADLLHSPGFNFQHPDFSSIDAEDSVQMMCFFLNRQATNFVPILNPDDGTLVSILGYIDLIHLLDQASKQHPELFQTRLDEMNISVIDNTQSALITTPLLTILESVEHYDGGIPIVDDAGTVVGIYHKADFTFVMKAADPQAVLTNLETFTVEDVLKLQARDKEAGEGGALTPPLVTCTMGDQISDILAVMMQARSDTVIVLDEKRKFVGTVSVREIVKFYLL